MTHRRPSRIAFALFDICVPENDALRGDLIEEFQAGRSRSWLWRQVLGAALYQLPLGPPTLARAEVWLVSTAILLLLSFEAVFVTNVVKRLIFGPPVQNIAGYLYLFHTVTIEGPSAGVMPLAMLFASLRGLLVAIPFGWLIGRMHRDHPRWSIVAFALVTHVWAAVDLQSLALQCLSMLSFALGMLLLGRIAVAADSDSAIKDRLSHMQ